MIEVKKRIEELMMVDFFLQRRLIVIFIEHKKIMQFKIVGRKLRSIEQQKKKMFSFISSLLFPTFVYSSFFTHAAH
jgi:hypothetical protein